MKQFVPPTGLKLTFCRVRGLVFFFFLLVSLHCVSTAQVKITALSTKSTDVIPTGNEWISLPTIRASDGSIESFNVLSMRDRGLLEVTGDRDLPAIKPYFMAGEKVIPVLNPQWQLIENWIPKATIQQGGLELTITYCVPYGFRAALIKLTVTNRMQRTTPATMGLRASWGRLSRVTYTPVELHGQRVSAPVPWGDTEYPGQAFSFVDTDTRFAWSLIYPGSIATASAPPVTSAPFIDAKQVFSLKAGESAETHFIVGVGVEEYSASQSAQALAETIDREGVDSIIESAAAWCRSHSRTTGKPDLDALMNRNLLFTALYAWGRTIDTEQMVGITSRSPRYYVSAAYWDRDALLWSFPGLLDIDPSLAREALEYAFTLQLRNTGTHSRFIDGVVLEDGFELDEAAAPILALAQYMQQTADSTFLVAHRDALAGLESRILSRYDPSSGLYSTLQDAQDQYRKQAYNTYNNVVVWRAFLNLGEFYRKLGDQSRAAELEQRARKLHDAILQRCIADAPGAGGKIFVSATAAGQHGLDPILADVPPGSLLKLPALGFVSEDDPIFVRTYEWLNSSNYGFSNYNKPFGMPGSYRVPFTTPWSVVDPLLLKRGRPRAMQILLGTGWDAGIVSEGIDPQTGLPDSHGPAFATAAGYVGHTICDAFCTDGKARQPQP